MKPAQRAAKIRQSFQTMHEGYQVGFAGQPRLTRAAGQLDAWVSQIKGFGPRIKTLPAQLRQELTELAKSRVELYQREAKAIREAQKMSPASHIAYRHIEWANLHSDRYQRHFAGQSRNTRDGSLLTNLSVEAQVWLEQASEHLKVHRDELNSDALNDLEQRIERFKESEAMYQSELKAITDAQSAGSPQEQADLCAHLANQCFKMYRAHFAGQSRASRSFATLEQLNTQLDLIRGHLEGLLSTSRAEFDDVERAEKNLEIIKQNLSSYQAEEAEVEKAQASLNYDGWVDGLTKAAQVIYDEYREHFAGRPRSACDPELLCHLCDRLYDVASQLRPFVEHSTDDAERGALLMMLDQLRLYHREFNFVREARAENAESADTVH